jgi:hypothetical protein
VNHHVEEDDPKAILGDTLGRTQRRTTWSIDECASTEENGITRGSTGDILLHVSAFFGEHVVPSSALPLILHLQIPIKGDSDDLILIVRVVFGSHRNPARLSAASNPQAATGRRTTYKLHLCHRRHCTIFVLDDSSPSASPSAKHHCFEQ